MREHDHSIAQRTQDENDQLKREIIDLKLRLQAQAELNDRLGKEVKAEKTLRAEIEESKNKQATKITELQGQLESERFSYKLD